MLKTQLFGMQYKITYPGVLSGSILAILVGLLGKDLFSSLEFWVTKSSLLLN